VWSGTGDVHVSNSEVCPTSPGTQYLSIFPTDATTPNTYLINSSTALMAPAIMSLVSTSRYGMMRSTYPPMPMSRCSSNFRILPGPGESDGQAVLVSIAADTSFSYNNDEPRLVQDAILDGLYPNPFMITYNSDTLVSLSGAIHASQNIYNNSFVGQIGDVIGFQGPALFAQLTIPGASFNGGNPGRPLSLPTSMPPSR